MFFREPIPAQGMGSDNSVIAPSHTREPGTLAPSSLTMATMMGPMITGCETDLSAVEKVLIALLIGSSRIEAGTSRHLQHAGYPANSWCAWRMRRPQPRKLPRGMAGPLKVRAGDCAMKLLVANANQNDSQQGAIHMIRFPILLAGVSLACLPSLALAQTYLERPADEGTQPSAQSEPGRRSGDAIVVLGRTIAGETVERAERYQARQIRDLFDADPSIDLAGGSRNGQRLFLRGVEGSNLNITVDGARQGQNLYNHRGGLQNIDPEILKRVEIQPGPSAADQGFGALGGAIRFETVDAQDRLLDGRRMGMFARASYGSAAKSKRLAVAAYGLVSDEVGILAYGTGTNFNDIRVGGGTRLPFSGGEDRTALVKLTIRDLNDHSLRIGYERNDADGLNFMQRGDYPWQLQPEDFRARPPQDQSLTRDTATLRYGYNPENQLVDIQLNAYSNRNDFFAPNSNGERFISQVTGGDLRNVFGWAIGEAEASTSVGVEWVRDNGTALRSDRGAFYNRNETFGQFLQQRIKTDLFSLGAGVRRDGFTADYGERTTSGAVWS